MAYRPPLRLVALYASAWQYLGTQRSQQLLDQITQTRALDQEGAIEDLYQFAKKAFSLSASP